MGARVRMLALVISLWGWAGACEGDGGEGDKGEGSEGDTSGEQQPACGTAEAPETLTITDVAPAPGSEVAGQAIHELRIVQAPGVFLKLLLTYDAGHTAGTLPAALPFTVTQDGQDLKYTATPVTWSTVPGHVKLSSPVTFVTDDGCHYRMPSPLFEYDVVPEAAGP